MLRRSFAVVQKKKRGDKRVEFRADDVKRVERGTAHLHRLYIIFFKRNKTFKVWGRREGVCV